MKKRSVQFIVLLLCISLCGVFTCFAEDNEIAGKYTLISLEYAGTEMDPAATGLESVLTLDPDGTGTLEMNGGVMPLPKWTLEDGSLGLSNPDGDILECTYADGIIRMEMGPGAFYIYANDAANPNAGKPESMLSQYLKTLDPENGIHLNYGYHSEYMDADYLKDVHAKGEHYYSLDNLKVKGLESEKAVLFSDGNYYNLQPDKMTGSIATTTTSAAVKSRLILMDNCYNAMNGYRLRKDYTVEDREVDGKHFTVEVFPETESIASAAFYFDEEGHPVHILVGAPPISPKLGENFYTIYSIDDKVDESLFSLDGYTIE